MIQVLGRVLRKPRFDVIETAAGFHVTLVSPNNEVLLSSESFPDERTARKNISAARRCVLRAVVNVRRIA